MIGKTRSEKRRFWLALLFAGIVSASWEKLDQFLFSPSPSDLAFDELNKRCLANIHDLSGIEEDEALRPYKLDVETLLPWASEFDGSTWRYAHVTNGNVEVTLVTLESALCSVQLEGVDFEQQNTAILDRLPLIPVQYPGADSKSKEYLLQFGSTSKLTANVVIQGEPEEDNIGVYVLIGDSSNGLSRRLGDALYGTPPKDLLYQEFSRLCIDFIGNWDQLAEDPLLAGKSMTEAERNYIGPAVLKGWVYSVPPFKQTKISVILDDTGMCTVRSSGENIDANITALRQSQSIVPLAVSMPTEEGQAFRLESDVLPGGVALVMTVPGKVEGTGEPSLVMSIQSERDFEITEGYSIRDLEARTTDW